MKLRNNSNNMMSPQNGLCIHASKTGGCIIDDLSDRIRMLDEDILRAKVERQVRIVRKIVSIRLSVVNSVESVSDKAKVSFA